MSKDWKMLYCHVCGEYLGDLHIPSNTIYRFGQVVVNKHVCKGEGK